MNHYIIYDDVNSQVACVCHGRPPKSGKAWQLLCRRLGIPDPDAAGVYDYEGTISDKLPVGYTTTLADPDGAEVWVWKFPGISSADISRARKWLFFSFDVVRIRVKRVKKLFYQAKLQREGKWPS